MRDIERIEPTLELIERVWREHPDWRLGQLLENVASFQKLSVWSIEEDELRAGLYSFLNK